MTELKPCPFCGGKAFQYTDTYDQNVYPKFDTKYSVLCRDCDGGVTSTISMNDAIKQWNRRVKE